MLRIVLPQKSFWNIIIVLILWNGPRTLAGSVHIQFGARFSASSFQKFRPASVLNTYDKLA